MAHVIAGLCRLGDDLAGRGIPGLAQRPERGRACSRTAETEHLAVAPLKHGFGLGNHLRVHAVAAQRNGMIGQPRCFGSRLDLGAGRLVGRFPIGAIVDDGSKAEILERFHPRR